jgi:hypothetical protein
MSADGSGTQGKKPIGTPIKSGEIPVNACGGVGGGIGLPVGIKMVLLTPNRPRPVTNACS